MIGPPAERLYAVDPVGVATIKPSARKLETNAPETVTRISTMRASALLLMVASLSTRYERSATDTSNVIRSSA